MVLPQNGIDTGMMKSGCHADCECVHKLLCAKRNEYKQSLVNVESCALFNLFVADELHEHVLPKL